MKQNVLSPKFLLIIAAVFLAAGARLIPHMPNFTPVAAMALFAGAHFSKKWMALLIPFAAMFLSDLVLGFHSYMFAVYISFGIAVLVGGIINGKTNPVSLIGASLGSSAIFFIITNLAVWFGSPFYAQNIQGMMQCYTMAIPFFGYSILGDLFYNGILFGSFYLLQKNIPALVRN